MYVYFLSVPLQFLLILASIVPLRFRTMPELGSGILIQLLEEMGIGKRSKDDTKPVLLQIRSIIPVLAGGGLWPNQGFFLRVSDSGHALYVSLPQEENEMVLCNRLQIGQFIFVNKLEVAYPVPMLKGIRPIPGRRPCVGDPVDLIAKESIEKFCGVSESSKRFVDQSDRVKRPRTRHSSTLRAVSGIQLTSKDIYDRGLSKNESNFGDSDTESVVSACSSVSAARRRSWIPSPSCSKQREMLDPTVIKREIKPAARAQSICVSAASSASYGGFDDRASSRTRRRDLAVVTPTSDKSSSGMRSSKIPLPPKRIVESSETVSRKRSCAETRILWNSISPRLANLGKEVLRQRDEAIAASIEALQEASTAERLLKCLSLYSELQLEKKDNIRALFDKFFSLQEDLSESRRIVQSLANDTSLRTADTEPNRPNSSGETQKLVRERKKKATLWIKTAIAFDLDPLPSSSSPTSKAPMNQAKIGAAQPDKTSLISRSKATLNAENLNDNTEVEMMNHLGQWTKGDSLRSASELGNWLHEKCKEWYLGHVERYLDDICIELKECSSSNVAETMLRIKRVSDWLDLTVKKEEGGVWTLKDTDLETYGRIRNKIYNILLKHAERTALLAFEASDAMQ